MNNHTNQMNHNNHSSDNIPTLRFPEFKGEWEKNKVGELCDSIVPGRNKPTNFEGEIPWITTPDIEHNGIIALSKKGLNISKEEAKKIGSKIVPKDSIIISCVGDLGLAAIAGKEIVINQQLHAFLPKEKIKYRFLLYQLNLQKKYMDMVATKTAVPYMNKDNCNSIPISFPTLPEQTKIAEFFTAIDAKIQALKTKKEKLQQYKKGVMQQLFTPSELGLEGLEDDRMEEEKNPTILKSKKSKFRQDDGTGFPKWEMKKLGEVCEIKKGEQLNKEELTEFGSYPCLNGGVSFSGYTEKFNSEENTITISEGGNSCGYINFMHTKFWLGGHCYKIVFTKGLNKNYFYQLLKFNEQKIMNLRVGSGLPNIQQKDIRNFEFVTSNSIEEQTKIANFLSSIDEKINHTETQIQQTQAYKKGLLQKMFM